LQKFAPNFADQSPKVQANHRFWWSCLLALAALATGALLLVSAYILLSPEARAYRAGDGANTTVAWAINTDDLITRIGAAQAGDNGGLEVTRLEGDRALLTRRLTLQARDYNFLQYSIVGRNPGQRIYLIWRTAKNPTEMFSQPLSWSGDKASTVRLAEHPDWQGSITEIGLDIYGELRGQPLVISNLQLLPGSVASLLANIWSQWTAFTGWSQKSINRLGNPRSELPSATEAAAVWTALAMILLYLARAHRRGETLLMLGVTILIPWLTLDLLWQHELNTQQSETRYLFSGKTMQERHLADEDSDIYRYANRLKTSVLPETPSRLFILHDSVEHDYARLKTQFYLLPHNIYNYGRFPKKQFLSKGDFILVLGTIPGLKYNESSETLAWGKGQQLQARLLDRDERGMLLMVASANAQSGKSVRAGNLKPLQVILNQTHK
jgi:hypothetical protein